MGTVFLRHLFSEDAETLHFSLPHLQCLDLEFVKVTDVGAMLVYDFRGDNNIG